MIPATTKRLNEIYHKFGLGRREEALQELRQFSKTLYDPWDKAEFLYHETLWLLEMPDISSAREKLLQLKHAVSSLARQPEDNYEIDLPTSITVMALFAELRVLLAEKNEAVALQVVEGLVAQYPKQLSNPDFKELSDEIAAYHGFLLADAGRWTEALALLEAQTFPLEWRNVQCYFLGRCYFEFGDYERARKKLIEALDLGLIDHWASKAHFTLGATEYRLGNMSAAKKHFELYLKTAPADSLSRVEAWEWLEMTCRALRLYDEAEQYGRIKKNGASAKTN